MGDVGHFADLAAFRFFPVAHGARGGTSLCGALYRLCKFLIALVGGSQMPAALVTGAGQRLGQAMAIALAQAGYDVAIHYASSREGAEATAAAVRAAGRQAVLVQADLLDEAATQALLPEARASIGAPFSVLVNNASIFEHDTFGGLTGESWDRHMNSNLRASVVLSEAFAAQAPK